MIGPWLLPAACIGMLSLTLTGFLLLRRQVHNDRLSARTRLAQGLSNEVPVRRSRSPLRIVAELGAAVAESGFLSPRTVSELEQTLAAAGFRSGNGLSLFIGGKLLGFVLLPLLAWFLIPSQLIGPLVRYAAVGGAGVFGLLLPDLVIRRLRARYLASVDGGLPDALDMLVICAEAGLGLVSAMTRVGTEIRPAHPAVADEFLLTANELHLMADSRIALNGMGARTGLASLKRLAATLIQSQHYGTPLSQALRALAAEMRQEMLIRFEERAARLPALLTVPMILFILPSVFMVVGGPAMIQVLRMMRH